MQNQMLFTPRLNGGVNPTFLSEVPGATAAYSLRRLSITYTGALIRVRRTDNQELDITGTTIGLDESQLLTFVGSGDAFVTTIYDQSGNNNHLTQSTIANQPRIVTAGVINKLNGRPAIFFDGVNDWFRRTFSIGTVLTRFAVISHASAQNDSVIVFDDGNTADRAYLTMSSTTTLRMTSAIGANLYYADVANNVQFSTYNLFNTTNSEISVDNRPIGTGSVSSSAVTYNGISIGTRGGLTPGYHASFHFQELIMYASNQSANRATAMNNINQHYQISWDGFRVGLLNLYPGAAAAYSLRNLSASYTGPLIRVRRDSDSVELDIYGKYDGTIDTQSLTSFCAGTNGFVRTWYDQSTNGRNATQVSASQQPQIVSEGALYYTNSKPALNSNINSKTLLTATDITFTSYYASIVSNVTGKLGNYAHLIGLGGSPFNQFYRNTDNWRYYSSSGDTATNVIFESGQRLITFQDNNTNTAIYLNGVLNTTLNLTPNVNNQDLRIIGFDNNNGMQGTFQECIFYTSDQSSNRTGIEGNINSFYQVY